MTAYSITPEGAKSAATEIVKGMNHGVPADENVDLSVTDHSWMKVVAAIILRHAEQSPKCDPLGTMSMEAMKAQGAAEAQKADPESSEGEMREALRNVQADIKRAATNNVIWPNTQRMIEKALGSAGREEKRDAE